MIYTSMGMPVKIVSSLAPEIVFGGLGTVTVQSTEDPTWVRSRHISTLKADGGMKEIEQAIYSLYPNHPRNNT